MTQTMITVSPSVAVTLLIAVVAMIFGFGKLLMMQFEKRLADREKAATELRDAERETDLTRLRQVERSLENETVRVGGLVTRIEQINGALPLEYVRREDWIRFSATIDAKLDRLAVMIHQHLLGNEHE